MSLRYSVITIWTSEEAAHKGARLATLVPQFVQRLKIAARCMVTRGVGGCYESGEVSQGFVEVLSFNMPIKIEIVLPTAEAAEVTRSLEELVGDGIILVQDAGTGVHKVEKRLVPRHLRVRDVMTASPVTVTERETAGRVARILLVSNFNGVPVVDARGGPVGMITQGDLMRRAGMPIRLGILDDLKAGQIDVALAALDKKTAGEVMTCPVVTVVQDAPLEKAIGMMLEKKLKRLPVVAAHGALRGVLARVDILRAISRHAVDWKSLVDKGVRVARDSRVRDVMRVDAPVVGPDVLLADLLAGIDPGDTRRIVVAAGEGRFLGVIFDEALFGALSEEPSLVQRILSAPSSIAKILSDKETAGGGRTAHDVMRTGVTTVTEDTRVEEAIAIMADKGIKRLPVVDAAGVYKGMISRDSLLRAGMERRA